MLSSNPFLDSRSNQVQIVRMTLLLQNETTSIEVNMRYSCLSCLVWSKVKNVPPRSPCHCQNTFVSEADLFLIGNIFVEVTTCNFSVCKSHQRRPVGSSWYKHVDQPSPLQKNMRVQSTPSAGSWYDLYLLSFFPHGPAFTPHLKAHPTGRHLFDRSDDVWGDVCGGDSQAV